MILSPRWRSILCDLWVHKTRTILIVLSVAVGVFAIGVITSSRQMLTRTIQVGYAAVSPASAVVYTTTYFDDALVQAVRNVRGVREAEGRQSVIVRFQVGQDEWRTMQLTAIADYDDIRINKLWPESKVWPPPEHEVLIERAALGMTKARVGDALVIETLDGKRRRLRIAGLVHDPGKNPAVFTGQVYGYIALDTLEWLGTSRGFNELYITVAENAQNIEHIQHITNQAQDKLEENGQNVWGNWIPKPGKPPTDDIVQTVLLILQVVSFFSLLLSGFLITNTISALLTQHVRQIGVMKAIGAHSGQIMGMYLGMVLVYGALALIIAIPLGMVGARLMTVYMAGLLNFDVTSAEISLKVYALQAIVGLLIPLLSAIYPIARGVRITAREAISTYGLGKEPSGKDLVSQLIEHVRGLPRPLLLSLRNTFRRRARLILTLATLTVASAAFVAVFSVRASMLHTLNNLFTIWSNDIEIGFKYPYHVDRIKAEALQVPGVVAVETWGFSSSARRQRAGGSEGENIWVYAPPSASAIFHPDILQGRWLTPEDENAIVINAQFSGKEPDIKVGDEIRLKIEGTSKTWTVVGILREMIGFSKAFANYSDLAYALHRPERSSRVYVVAERHDDIFQSQMAQALEERFNRAGLQVNETSTTTKERLRIKSIFDVVVSFLLIIAALLTAIGGLCLMGTMSINVLERTHEIGVMRAVGASSRAVLQIVLVEGILIGMIGWLGGSVLALPLSRLLGAAVGMALLNAPLIYVFPLEGILVWLAVVVVLSALASFLPAWNASHIKVSEALAYE